MESQEIDTNPHAEIPPPAPMPNPAEDPFAFVRACRDRCPEGVAPFSRLSEPFAAVVEAGRMAFEPSHAMDGARPALVALRVADAIQEIYRQSYGSNGAHGFVRVGGFSFPPTPDGIEALRIIREYAPGIVRGNVDGFAAEGSELARVSDCFRFENAARVRVADTRGILESVTNATVATSDPRANPAGYVQFGIGVKLRPDLAAQLPAQDGPRIRSMLAPRLEGYEFDGSDIDSWREHVGACASGTIEFLNRFDIYPETEGGEYECDSCGCTTGDDEHAEIYSCPDFEITERMARALDKAGYLDGTLEWIQENGDGATSDGWEELDRDYSTAELVAQYGPQRIGEDSKLVGALYDPNVWTFEPAPEELDGFEDIDDVPTLLSLGRKLGAVADAHTAVGSLPPIPGRLTLKPRRVGNFDAERVELRWDPDAGTLRAVLTGRAALVVDVAHGGRSVHVCADPAHPGRVSRFPLDADGTLSLPKDAAGPDAALYLRIASATVSL